MGALKLIPAHVWVLLTDEESKPALEPLAAECGFDVFCGPKDDVLLRYALAAERYRSDIVIRATGDNPLVSGELAASLLEMHRDKGADFSGFLGPPLGTGVEIIQTSALLTAREEAADPYEREHVSPFIYRRPDRFLVYRPQAPSETRFPAARVTLDTAEDYQCLQTIFDSLYRGVPIPTKVLVAWLNRGGWESLKERSTVGQDSFSAVRKTG
jgi:spore coat polysaccharide biosynthesis protein SpsF